MSAMCNLVKNETIKIFKQTAPKILVILTLISVIVVPLFLYGIGVLINVVSKAEYDESMYEYEYSEDDDPLWIAYDEAYVAADRFFGEAGYTYGSWIYSAYYSQYYDLCMEKAIYELILEEYDYDDIYYQFQWEIDSFGYSEESLTAEFCEERLAEIEAELQSIEAVVEKGDLSEIAESKAEMLEEQIKLYELYKEDPESMSMYSETHVDEYLEELIGYLEAVQRGYEAIASDEDFKDEWKLSVISSLETSVEYFTLELPMTEDAFKESYEAEYYEDYEEYRAYCEESLASYRKNIKLYSYSLDHEIPISSGATTSGLLFGDTFNTKSLWQTSLVSCITGLTSIFMLVIAAVSVASEYTSGTIRMLLIRPRKRWKILASKYIAVVMSGFVICVLAFVVQFLIAILLKGTEAIGYNDLYFSLSGEIYEVNSVISTFSMLLKAFLQNLFMTTFAFMMSTLAGKTVVAIICPYALSMVASIASAILIGLSNIPGFEFIATIVGYTFIPYIEYSQYAVTAVSEALSADMIGITMTAGNVYIGAVVLIFWIAVMLFFSFLGFNKREIKS